MSKACLFIVIASCWLSATADAVLPLAQEGQGIVEWVDQKCRTFTVTFNDKPRSRQLVWNYDTVFIDRLKFTTPAELKAGVIVRVRYQLPIFGKPFATRVAVTKPERRKHETKRIR